MRNRLAMLAVLVSVVLAGAGCSTFFKPVLPGESYDETQQRIFAVAAIGSIAICGDVRESVKASEREDIAAGFRVVGAAVGNAVSPNQLENELRALMGAGSKGIRTAAALTYGVNAFIPPDFKQTLFIAVVKNVADNCAVMFETDGGAA